MHILLLTHDLPLAVLAWSSYWTKARGISSPGMNQKPAEGIVPRPRTSEGARTSVGLTLWSSIARHARP